MPAGLATPRLRWRADNTAPQHHAGRDFLAAAKDEFKPPPHEIGNFVAYGLAILALVLGPVMARGARDDEIYVFGLSLFGFAALFLFSELKGHFDIADAAHAARRGSGSAEGGHE